MKEEALQLIEQRGCSYEEKPGRIEIHPPESPREGRKWLFNRKHNAGKACLVFHSWEEVLEKLPEYETSLSCFACGIGIGPGQSHRLSSGFA